MDKSACDCPCHTGGDERCMTCCEVSRLRARAEAAEKEAERLRHGMPVEGDFVCPDSLRVHHLEKAIREIDAASWKGNSHAACLEFRLKISNLCRDALGEPRELL